MTCTLLSLLILLVCMASSASDAESLTQVESAEICPDTPSHASMTMAHVYDVEMALLQQGMKFVKQNAGGKTEFNNEGASSLVVNSAHDLSTANESQKSELLHFYGPKPDEHGHLCALCVAPLPDRINTTYKFRDDCGNHSIFEDTEAYERPLIEFSRPANGKQKGTNAYCELNYQKTCADSIENKDFLMQAKSIVIVEADIWDLEYCRLNGFLAPKYRRLQHDFNGMSVIADELCNTKYLKYGWNSTLTFKDMHGTLKLSRERPPTLHEAEFSAAGNCAMGSLGCSISFCAYTYCDKGNGLIDIYNKCEGWDPVMGMPPTAST